MKKYVKSIGVKNAIKSVLKIVVFKNICLRRDRNSIFNYQKIEPRIALGVRLDLWLGIIGL